MGRLGFQEILLILLVCVLLFGGVTKLPQIARSLGESIKEFKKAVTEKHGRKTKEEDK